ncbi:hypothetical protein GCM10010275_30190 [Streptomyces litmocidini]|uniref:hypothetical protein n=1 Tax=Streptomyces litmocidini TaxID=67318 RepID=UPI00167CE381|nr:hypothetical protein [Streptomyces litmocidini]GGU91095.1 hypothetical protein GCM10010275_30190 [Streptomyces litmocidini]
MLRRPAVLALAAFVAFLIAVGMWPAAIAPVTLAASGLAAVLAVIPGPVYLLAGVIAWLKYRPQPKPATA